LEPNSVPDALQIAVAWATVFGAAGVLVAGIALWIQWLRGREERRERTLQLAALEATEANASVGAAQAPTSVFRCLSMRHPNHLLRVVTIDAMHTQVATAKLICKTLRSHYHLTPR
jgi:hypothetical protein